MCSRRTNGRLTVLRSWWRCEGRPRDAGYRQQQKGGCIHVEAAARLYDFLQLRLLCNAIGENVCGLMAAVVVEVPPHDGLLINAEAIALAAVAQPQWAHGSGRNGRKEGAIGIIQSASAGVFSDSCGGPMQFESVCWAHDSQK